SRFHNAAAFASWACLCPRPQVSGGRVLNHYRRPNRHRLARALRMAAFALHHNRSPMGDYYRRMRARLGAPKAITATAHKLARIIYHMLTTGHPYDPSPYAQVLARTEAYALKKLKRQAQKHGFQLVPVEVVP
ncbi:MAG: transposase, partial [Chloroflexota bacterium]